MQSPLIREMLMFVALFGGLVIVQAGMRSVIRLWAARASGTLPGKSS